MASLKTLHDLFVHELRDIYNAEKQLLKALPKMAKAASSDGLRAGFEEHLQVAPDPFDALVNRRGNLERQRQHEQWQQCGDGELRERELGGEELWVRPV